MPLYTQPFAPFPKNSNNVYGPSFFYVGIVEGTS